MSQELWDLLKAINQFFLPFSCFYLGYLARDKGYFQPNRWTCPAKGCSFQISGSDPVGMAYVRDRHIMIHERDDG